MPGIAEVVEAVATKIAVAWQPSGSDEVLRREFVAAELSELVGRKVWVFHRGEGQVGKAARRVNLMEYRVSVIVGERYTGGGDLPDEWVNERTDWTRVHVVDPLGDEQRMPVLVGSAFVRECWPQRAEILEVADRESTRLDRLFLSLVEVDYQRLVEV